MYSGNVKKWDNKNLLSESKTRSEDVKSWKSAMR